MEFVEFIEKTNQSKTVEQLFGIYQDAVAEHGLDKVIFALETDHRDLDLRTGHGIHHSYPMDWLGHYLENGYDKIDPVRCYGVFQTGAFTWEDMAKKMPMSKAQKKCFNRGIESGLNNGIAVALRDKPGELAGMALASSEKKDSYDGNIDLINAYSNQFYMVFKRLSQKNESTKPDEAPIKLTNSEYETLTWLALGKNKPEIADILYITVHTVDFHIRNCYKKLQANSQALAITKAISMGLIHPYPYR